MGTDRVYTTVAEIRFAGPPGTIQKVAMFNRDQSFLWYWVPDDGGLRFRVCINSKNGDWWPSSDYVPMGTGRRVPCPAPPAGVVAMVVLLDG